MTLLQSRPPVRLDGDRARTTTAGHVATATVVLALLAWAIHRTDREMPARVPGDRPRVSA